MCVCVTCGSVRLLQIELSGEIRLRDGGAGAQALVETSQENRETQDQRLQDESVGK